MISIFPHNWIWDTLVLLAAILGVIAFIRFVVEKLSHELSKRHKSNKKRIELKVWPHEFQAILDGKKNFELRLGNFECKEGDLLLLREWNPNQRIKNYTGREIEVMAGYVMKIPRVDWIQYWSPEEVNQNGLQIISLQ